MESGIVKLSTYFLLQKEAFEDYSGSIKQSSVGFQVSNHQELIGSVYQGVLDGLDD